MKVAIVDDNLNHIKEIEKILSSLCIFKTIDCYNNGFDFLNHVSEYNYVCLDIEMNNLDGIEISKKLSEHKIKIIFVTNHPQRMIDAFGINVAKFILKKDMNINLKSFFLEEYRKINKFINVHINRENLKIFLNDIVYIESSLGDVRFHLNNKTTLLIRCKSLKSIEEKLDDSFYQINRNTIINIKYITDFDNNCIKLLDEYKQVSRRNINGLRYKLYEEKLYYEFDHIK